MLVSAMMRSFDIGCHWCVTFKTSTGFWHLSV
jgi:hypothetical protein